MAKPSEVRACDRCVPMPPPEYLHELRRRSRLHRSVWTLRRSKGDQEGEGTKKGIPFGRHALTCPVTAVRDYMDMSGVSEGPLFRPINRHGQVGEVRLGDKAVALVVKRAAAAAGLDPTQYAGHSLRAGLATSAAAGGAQERDIMRQTGHRSIQIVCCFPTRCPGKRELHEFMQRARLHTGGTYRWCSGRKYGSGGCQRI